MVRFIERGLYGDAAFAGEREKSDDIDVEESITPAPPAVTAVAAAPQGSGAVFVHCAMGKSRSVTAVVAWLLWKYPHRFGNKAERGKGNEEAAMMAVGRAVEWVRRARGIAEPNPGFMRQLALWWEMGCPAEGGDDAVARNRLYRRWAYKREVEESAKVGSAPDRLRFEDEVGDDEVDGAAGGGEANGRAEVADGPSLELRCKKCRRVLATQPFVVPHKSNDSQSLAVSSGAPPTTPASCSHFFIEPLSWMRPVLEEGVLEGRLMCPNDKCGASVGRYSWQGFKCSCGEWVCPAFSLQRGRVDDVVTNPRPNGGPRRGPVFGAEADRMAAMGIRLPPGARASATKENL